jgi:hypothetical protein
MKTDVQCRGRAEHCGRALKKQLKLYVVPRFSSLAAILLGRGIE